MSRLYPDLSHPDDAAERESLDEAWRASQDIYGEPPDAEITPEVWAFVHAQYVRPTTDRAFYTLAALVEQRHRSAQKGPDLLSALQACVREMRVNHPGDDSYWKAVSDAEAAIARPALKPGAQQ